MAETQTWEVWYPEAAATGLLVARGHPVARGEDLARAGEQLPMTRLWVAGGEVRREDRWPTAADFGSRVLLPSGEVGTPTGWWHAGDGSEWRWSAEFYNYR